MNGYSLFYGLWDPTYSLVIIGAVLCMLASAFVKRTFEKYSKYRSMSGLTGAMAAEKILRSQGIYDVRVEHVRGNLTDHYDPARKILNLSDSVYGSTSVAAIGVAAHECGHAVQHQKAYIPLKIRGSLVPAANFGSTLSWPMIFIGLFIRSNTGTLLIEAGIILFSLVVLFQLITLPVEFNASSRAIKILDEIGILGQEELKDTKKVLGAAAMTYVASAAAGILQLLRLLLILGGRNRD